MEAPPPAVPALSRAEREAAIAKARRDRGAAPAPPTIESSDSELRRALAEVTARPSAAAHIGAGHAYARVGVLDLAIEHFDKAIALDPRSAAAFDGRARIWRDWGILAYALADATRAAHYAPDSAAVHNTRGTVLTMLGQCESARAAYRRALALDPGAVYAQQNLEGEGAAGCPSRERPTRFTRQPRTR